MLCERLLRHVRCNLLPGQLIRLWERRDAYESLGRQFVLVAEREMH